MISGFLITGLLLCEIEVSGTIRRSQLYARRVRRLLPAAALVLAAVAALTYLALPTLRRAGIATDIRWSARYTINWRFAAQAVDYLAAEEAAGPLQHFWSLAVEEQSYLLWPLVLLATGRIATRRDTRIRPTLLALPALVAVISDLVAVPNRRRTGPSLVWRDTHHLTATYARLLSGAFAHQMRVAIPTLFAAEQSE